MKILIAYSSKTGTAADCVERLVQALRGLDVTVADLDRETPELAAYGMVIAGSSVRFGKARRSFGDFLKANREAVQALPHAFFLCCGFGHEFEGYVKKQIPTELLETAFAVMNFGGKLKLENASRWERYLLYRIRSAIRESEIDDGEYTPTLPGILPENIDRMADHVRRQL